MAFDDILAQVMTLLQRQGRVSYRALKMRFDLDDEYLDVLKEELLYVHPVRDDEGRGLVWTGETASVQAVASQPGQPTPPPAAQQQPSLQVTPFPTAHPPEAERSRMSFNRSSLPIAAVEGHHPVVKGAQFLMHHNRSGCLWGAQSSAWPVCPSCASPCSPRSKRAMASSSM
jgi:hypothetical protein